MESIQLLRNNIVDKLLSITNKEYLVEINAILDKNNESTKELLLSPSQKKILMLSEEDIKNGKLFTQAEVDKKDLQWLKEM